MAVDAQNDKTGAIDPAILDIDAELEKIAEMKDELLSSFQSHASVDSYNSGKIAAFRATAYSNLTNTQIALAKLKR